MQYTKKIKLAMLISLVSMGLATCNAMADDKTVTLTVTPDKSAYCDGTAKGDFTGYAFEFYASKDGKKLDSMISSAYLPNTNKADCEAAVQPISVEVPSGDYLMVQIGQSPDSGLKYFGGWAATQTGYTADTTLKNLGTPYYKQINPDTWKYLRN